MGYDEALKGNFLAVPCLHWAAPGAAAEATALWLNKVSGWRAENLLKDLVWRQRKRGRGSLWVERAKET